MNEETNNQRPAQSDAAVERPRRPRRRFPRRHDGPRGHAPEGQRGDLNGPADRVEELEAPAGSNTEGRDGNQRSEQGDDRAPGAEGDLRDRGSSQNGELEREPEFGDGIIEISGKGFGFLRDAKRNFVQTPQDIFVTPEIVRRFGLRDGMWIHGETRRGNRGPQLTRLLKINDDEPTKYQGLRPFEELTTINPNRRIKLETVPDRYTTRIMDLMTPLGMGQRGLIVAPPRTGKTTLLHHIADAVVKNHPEMKLIILLVDERPEEVTDFRRSCPLAEIMASSNDSDIKSHTRIAQLAVERAKRLVEAGKDVFILLDSITRTARAFNNATGGGGRTMSGGIDARAMEIPRKLFSAARNTEEAGSLTIVATALIDTGSRMDELIFQEFKGTGNMEMVLDRKISDQRTYPAVDIFLSGTRREELLMQQWELDKINMIRRGLAGHKPGEAIERLLMFVKKFPTNTQMLKEIPG
ncbi:MAG: transcription termination factor Rho [Verrucomicrobia bacterium]|nr:MAG: transcription termination factor Rho [Verrucomicrobiota bacterium]